MVANKVKRNRSARHSNKGGGVQLEIDAYGKLRKVGGTAEEEEAKRKREAAKRGHVGYYRKVRARHSRPNQSSDVRPIALKSLTCVTPGIGEISNKHS